MCSLFLYASQSVRMSVCKRVQVHICVCEIGGAGLIELEKVFFFSLPSNEMNRRNWKWKSTIKILIGTVMKDLASSCYST